MVLRMARRPGWPCAVLLITGVIALMLGGLALYARHAVLDARRVRRPRDRRRSHQDEVDRRDRRADRRRARSRATRRWRCAGPILEAAVADVVARPALPRPSSTPARSRCTTRSSVTAASASGRRRRGAPILVRVTALPLPGAGRELRAAVAARSPARPASSRATTPCSSRSAAARSRPRSSSAAPTRSGCPRSRRWPSLLGLAAAGPGGVARRRRADSGCGGPRWGSRSRAGRWSRRPRSRAPWSSRPSTRRTATRSSARSGAPSSADLRLWALAMGAVGVIAAAAIEPGAPGAWRRLLAARDVAFGSVLRLARAAGCSSLAVLLLWMPEVAARPRRWSLAAGLLVFSGAAEVVRSAQRSLIR